METRLAVTVELADTRSHAVIWSDRFSGGIGDIHQIRTGISDQVISALELHIPLNEARRARLQPPETLDAWDIYHLGLQHMYRFNRADNLQAALHFEHASRLDPNFARAYAARSFTSFQSAFLKYAPDRAREVENARRFAESCLELDPLDPFGNFTLGRAHWLQGDPEAGLPWIDRAISLSPNFAQGFYAHALCRCPDPESLWRGHCRYIGFRTDSPYASRPDPGNRALGTAGSQHRFARAGRPRGHLTLAGKHSWKFGCSQRQNPSRDRSLDFAQWNNAGLTLGEQDGRSAFGTNSEGKQCAEHS